MDSQSDPVSSSVYPVGHTNPASPNWPSDKIYAKEAAIAIIENTKANNPKNFVKD